MLDYTFERQIELEKRDSKEEGRNEMIDVMISICSEIGLTREQIINQLSDKIPLTSEEAQAYVDNWKKPRSF